MGRDPERSAFKEKFWKRTEPTIWQSTTMLVVLGGVASVSFPEGIKALTGLLGVIVWPCVLLLCLSSFRGEVGKAIGRLTEFDAFGLKAKLQIELDQAASEAKHVDERIGSPTESQVERANEVKNIFGNNLDILKNQVENLSQEYQDVRSSLPPGDHRTRRLEVIVAKMRTVGLAAYSMRYDLAYSSSPGKRLQAIACLQVKSDFELIDWLADRVEVEKPFVAYHALIALNVAASDPLAKSQSAIFPEILRKVKNATIGLADSTDRKAMVVSLERKIKSNEI